MSLREGTTQPSSLVAARDPETAPDLTTLTARELGAAVTPLFILPNRFQQQALNELVIRCEVADRLLAERKAG